MIRTFIAVEPSAEVRRAAARVTAGLMAGWRAGSVRWVPPENLHLTLRFLGGTEESRVGPLIAALDEVTADAPGCELTLGSLGAFPDERRPRVLWIGLGGTGTVILRSLQRRIEKRVGVLGWDHQRRPFSPHLTLGRVRAGTDPDPVAGWTRAAVPELAFGVEEVVLMRSDLHPGGARYSVLHRSRLGEGSAIPARPGAGTGRRSWYSRGGGSYRRPDRSRRRRRTRPGGPGRGIPRAGRCRDRAVRRSRSRGRCR